MGTFTLAEQRTMWGSILNTVPDAHQLYISTYIAKHRRLMYKNQQTNCGSDEPSNEDSKEKCRNADKV